LNYNLDLLKTKPLLNHLLNTNDFNININEKKHQIDFFDSERNLAVKIKLPWFLPPLVNLNELKYYLKNVEESPQYYMIILIQAGHSALGTVVNGKILKHKVIEKYMVRKKQGKAQISYLHSKGKSRAGSRIRLTQTVEFFEEINQRLIEWLAEQEFGRILISCPVRLWGMLNQSKIRPPFEKKDPRILKIPMDVKVPKYQVLLHVNHLAQQGSVEIYEDKNLGLIDGII